jgi:two-component system, OmpR family, sensor kinase
MTQLTLVGPARVLDRQRITLAMLQLALNATQHTTTDQEIHLGTEIRGDQLHLWVRDTGP